MDMEMKMKEQLAESIISKTKNIPDHVQKAFVKRAVEDARTLLAGGGSTSLDKLSYVIYRAYTLGAALNDKDQLISKFEELEASQDETSKKPKVKKNNVVSLEKARRATN